MLDAGVPLKASVAGIAMGLILNTKECGGDGEPLILSDILGSEDALGDMDFKVNITSILVPIFLVMILFALNVLLLVLHCGQIATRTPYVCNC